MPAIASSRPAASGARGARRARRPGLQLVVVGDGQREDFDTAAVGTPPVEPVTRRCGLRRVERDLDLDAPAAADELDALVAHALRRDAEHELAPGAEVEDSARRAVGAERRIAIDEGDHAPVRLEEPAPGGDRVAADVVQRRRRRRRGCGCWPVGVEVAKRDHERAQLADLARRARALAHPNHCGWWRTMNASRMWTRVAYAAARRGRRRAARTASRTARACRPGRGQRQRHAGGWAAGCRSPRSPGRRAAPRTNRRPWGCRARLPRRRPTPGCATRSPRRRRAPRRPCAAPARPCRWRCAPSRECPSVPVSWLRSSAVVAVRRPALPPMARDGSLRLPHTPTRRRSR